MPDSTTPADPEPDDGAGSVSPAPTEGTPAAPSNREPRKPDAPRAPQPTDDALGGRGGCMTAMIGLFVFIAAVLGIATQL